MNRIDRLRREYRETWQILVKQLESLQCLTSTEQRDYLAIEEALDRVHAARTAHNAVRDALAATLGSPQVAVAGLYTETSVISIDAPGNTTPVLMTRA